MDSQISNRGDNSVRDLQATLFPVSSPANDFTLPRLLSAGPGSFLGNLLMKTNQVELEEERPGTTIARLREPRDLFALQKDQPCPALQTSRWPAECQVIDERIEHIQFSPATPEQFYAPHGREVQPKPLGEEYGSVVYQYYPVCAINYFNRACVGGSRYLQPPLPDLEEDDLRFESRFESGNLAKAIKITSTFYELYVRTDLYTNRHSQWYYFKIGRVRRHLLYRFSIVNLSKAESLYSHGMKPLMYSTKDAKLHSIGWRRCGTNISYFCNENGNPEEDQPSTYTLTFTLEFPHDNDEIYLAHSFPYTYTDLQEYLTELSNHPVKSTYSTLRLLCRSLAGNNIYYLTVTSPPPAGEPAKKKKAIVISARVHPGEAPSSWIMKGVLDFITGDSGPARELRDKFIFKLIPMLNPDGVIVGNSRCSLTGRDLNRQYRTVIRETYPSIWHTKLMIRRLIEDCGVAMYCDIHAHSRQNNIFIYGCENRRGVERNLFEQIFPLMLHKNAADKFSFESCKFRVQKCKEGTGRVVMWMMGIANSFTLEASFAGSDLGTRFETHFSTFDYEQIGRTFCQTLLDYYDEAPHKEKLRGKILKRLLREGSTADDPTNINLSDYSSDEGGITSSDEDGRALPYLPFQVPPPSPNFPKKVVRKKAMPLKKNCPCKSPTMRRRVLPMYRTTLGLTLAESDSSGSDSGNEVCSARVKTKKSLRRKKPKKAVNKSMEHRDHSDTDINMSKTRKSVSVMDILPGEKMRSKSWTRYTGLPIPRNSSNDPAQNKNIKRQLAEVQAKLESLRHRLWTGMDETNYTEPLSWGFSTFSTTNLVQVREIEPSKKVKDVKKNKMIEPDIKVDKKARKKKRDKDETKKQPTKKKSNGIRRQSNVDWGYNEKLKKQSKSFPETEPIHHHHHPNSCNEADENRTKIKKKKKRKGHWEKKIKTVTNMSMFIRK